MRRVAGIRLSVVPASTNPRTHTRTMLSSYEKLTHSTMLSFTLLRLPLLYHALLSDDVSSPLLQISEQTTPVIEQEPIQYPPILSTQPDVGAEEDAESVVSGVSAVSGVSGVQLTKQLSASSIASPTTTAVAPHHQEIAKLIKHLDPSQEEFIDMLLAQFRGREDELLESLQQIQEETKAETMEAPPPMVAA